MIEFLRLGNAYIGVGESDFLLGDSAWGLIIYLTDIFNKQFIFIINNIKIIFNGLKQ
jgi:hypothetical protein